MDAYLYLKELFSDGTQIPAVVLHHDTNQIKILRTNALHGVLQPFGKVARRVLQ